MEFPDELSNLLFDSGFDETGQLESIRYAAKEKLMEGDVEGAFQLMCNTSQERRYGSPTSYLALAKREFDRMLVGIYLEIARFWLDGGQLDKYTGELQNALTAAESAHDEEWISVLSRAHEAAQQENTRRYREGRESAGS